MKICFLEAELTPKKTDMKRRPSCKKITQEVLFMTGKKG
jgi:hypothetical protein